MGRQTDAFRKMHPEQFSDSKTVQVGNLDRAFLDFYFETLTSRNMDKAFEDFCRHLAEVEICPNLLPQTGPTGGGDSKVDSETYPVAESISETWYYGDGNKASTERWAFAISAKKEWKSKIKSDVEKIAKVNQEKNRGYTKIFFMSNQYISDKKRADTEDELRMLYGIDIRIIDRTWLLDKTLKSDRNIEIAIKSFGLSDSFSNKIQVGERDNKRSQEYKQIEVELAEDSLKPSEKVRFSQKSVILARELEYDKKIILGLIERNNRIAKEYGTIINQADAIYDAAWTIYWWYSDYTLFYEYYKKYEEIALKENNVNLFKNLVTLWINLYSASFDSKAIDLIKHTNSLKEKYKYYVGDESKPNTKIEAKASYQLIRLFLGDPIDDIVNDIIQILEESFGHLDLDLYPICRVIQEIPAFENAKRFAELFESVVSFMSNQKQKAEAALMLAKRGHALKQKKPYEALAYFSRSLMGLYNQENKSQLINIIIEMGDVFQKIGLLWAARNFYYYGFCLCLNQYMKFGGVHPGLIISSYSLKYIELRLGHILYASTFHTLSSMSQELYPKKIKITESETDNFDFILAIQLLRTSYETEKSLGQLPKYLEKQGLLFSEAAIEYELGYYNKLILDEFEGNTEAFDDLIAKCIRQPAIEQLNYLPWYGIEESCLMQTNLLGCSIELRTYAPYDHGGIEIGATILATVESFFGTGIANELVSFSGKIKIELKYDANCSFLIQGEISKERPNVIMLTYRDYKSEDIITAQKEFLDFSTNLIAMVTSIMFPYDSQLNKIEKMIKQEKAFERSQFFANSVFFGMETLGKNTFSFSVILSDFDEIKMKRRAKSEITDIKNKKVEVEPLIAENIVHNSLPENFDFKNISNNNVVTSSIINIPLWNICGWRGVLFSVSQLHEFPPILSFAFMNTSCKNIFEEWRNDIGSYDSENKIGIRIIKGIDKNLPYSYRVIIGQQGFSKKCTDSEKIIAMPIRFHNMQPSNNYNLKMFEQELRTAKRFCICPTYMKDFTSEPKVFDELLIEKNVDSIVICDACDVQANDLLIEAAILPTDNPIIPKGKEDSPILDIIKRKKYK